MDIKELQQKAKKAETINKKFFEKLKRKKPKDLDDNFQREHEEVFENVDCLKCGNCCKTTSPIFYQKDIERAAKGLRMKASQFIEKYLHVDEDDDFVLNSTPCAFLDSENYCLIYEDRPNACREYPHTNRKRVHQVLDITLRNTAVCPAVYQIVEKLKKVYQ